jgi:hypothetical protein
MIYLPAKSIGSVLDEVAEQEICYRIPRKLAARAAFFRTAFYLDDGAVSPFAASVCFLGVKYLMSLKAHPVQIIAKAIMAAKKAKTAKKEKGFNHIKMQESQENLAGIFCLLNVSW